MTALSQAYCFDRPLTCGAVQRALERSPGLRFVPGVGFRHAYDATSPSPPCARRLERVAWTPGCVKNTVLGAR